MVEKLDPSEEVTAELTPEEQKIIGKALKRVETEIFQNVLKRLSVWLGIVLSIFLVGGLFNLNACSTNIESSTAQKLANDPELRERISNKAQENLKDIQEKLKKLNERAAEMEEENAQSTVMAVSDLKQIRVMLERISKELSDAPPPKRNGTTEGGNKTNE